MAWLRRTALKLVCSWCKKDMGEKEPLDDVRTSHVICDECRDKWVEQARQDKGLEPGTQGR